MVPHTKICTSVIRSGCVYATPTDCSGGAILCSARTGAGLSRRALAARAGVATSMVSRIENGDTDVTLSMLRRLLAAAGRELVIDSRQSGDRPAIAALATAVEVDRGRLKIDWTRLRGFADWAQQHVDDVAAAIADPPARTGTPLDAILAAFAEQLADEHGMARPRWTRAVGSLAEV